jgi:hypothetical protein
MKKLFVHLSMLALLAALLVPMVGCGKKDSDVEETSATSTTTESATTSAEPMATDMGTGTGMTSDNTMGGGMGSDMGTSTTAPMGTEMTPPPAGK